MGQDNSLVRKQILVGMDPSWGAAASTPAQGWAKGEAGPRAHGYPSWPRSAFSLGQLIIFSYESLLSDPLLPNSHGKFWAKKLKERKRRGWGGEERKKERQEKGRE